MSDDFTKNAFTEYENVIAEASGEAGGLGTKKGGLLENLQDKAASIKNSALLKNPMDLLNNGLASLKNAVVEKLSLGTNNIFKDNPLQIAANSLFSTGSDMLSDMLSDATKNLKNAAITYAGNIVSDFVENLASAIFIPDKVFVATIKGMYFGANADLAYNNHYIRKSALKNDWDLTLAFIDEQYGITYSVNYTNLKNDVITCARNSCCKNLLYIYGKLYEWYSKIKSDIKVSEDRIKVFKSSGNEKSDSCVAEQKLLDSYNKYESTVRNLMVEGVYELIINSYTSVNAANLKQFFTKFPDVLKPKYYGTTDDKYNQRYLIRSSNCEAMMPPFEQHDTNLADMYVSEMQKFENAKLEAQAAHIAATNEAEGDMVEIIKKTDGYGGLYSDAEIYKMECNQKIKEKISSFRQNTLERQAATTSSLYKSATTKGSGGVYSDIRARYPKQNNPGDVVKYRKGLNETLSNMFDDNAEYIEPKNKNIKEIYIMLSSEPFWKDDRMINDYFYNRCRLPTMTTLKGSFDKVKGILGSSSLVQGAYSLSDAIDGAAYNYLKKVENSLFNPKKHTEDGFKELFTRTFDMDDSMDNMVLPSKDRAKLESIIGPEMTNALIMSKSPITETSGEPVIDYNILLGENSSNEVAKEEMTSLLEKYPAKKVELLTDIKYINSIPMIQKRNILVRYLKMFYDICEKSGISKTSYQKAFANLCMYVFNKGGISEPVDLETKIFEYATETSLNDNVRVLLAIYQCKAEMDVMDIREDQFKYSISDSYNIVMNLMSLELKSYGFTEAVFKYDREYLASLLKQTFTDKVNELKGIADKKNPLFNTFYKSKDKLTTLFVGYDRNGIIGYDDKDDRIQFTNIEIGDWRDVKVTPAGTFIVGSDNTPGNGIRILNESTKQFDKTNITSGNWKSIIHDVATTFFINDDNKLYYWANNRVLPTNIDDINDWEPYISGYSNLFLFSKLNDGVMYWNGATFIQITPIGSGWVLDRFNANGTTIHILYPTINSGKVFIGYDLNNMKGFEDLQGVFNNFILKKFLYTTISTPASGGGVTSLLPTTTTSDIFGILAGSDSGIYWLGFNGGKIYTDSNTGLIHRPIIDSLIDVELLDISKGYTYVFDLTPDSFGYISGNALMTQQLELNPESVSTSTQQPISPYTFIIEDFDTVRTFEKDLINYTKCGNFDLLHFETFKAYKNNNIKSTDVTVIESKSGTYFGSELEDRLMFKTSDNYYSLNGDEYESLFTEESDITTGWVLDFVDNKYFLRNIEHPLGIRAVTDYKAVSTNLSNGYWKIAYSDDYIFALSWNGTDGGIKCSSRRYPYSFKEIPDVHINFGDFVGWDYDPDKKLTYFSSCRDNLVQNLDNVIYDIDEFIYPLYDYQIKKILESLSAEKSDTMVTMISNSISSMIDGGTSGGGSSGDGSGGGSSGDGSSGGDSSDTITPEQLSELVNIIKEEVDRVKDSQNGYELNSNLYTNLLTSDLAKREFDMSDSDVRNEVGLELILNSGDEKFDALIRYYTCTRKTYIKHHFKDTGEIIQPEEIGTDEWNRDHNNTTYDFLNSDVDGIIY